MQISTVALISLYIVSSTCLHGALGNTQYRNVPEIRDFTTKEPNPRDITRKKRQVGVPNPCVKPVVLIKPNFNVTGRRISEIKCYEYIWEVKVRDEVEKRQMECEEYRAKWGPYFIHSVIIGRDTFARIFPHMGAIGWKAAVGTWVFLCGSSLISPKFMLTAAHCSRDPLTDIELADPVPKIVRLGDNHILDIRHSIFGEPTDVNIKRFIVHPNYKSPKKYNDIALIELEKEITFTKAIQPACLWTHPDTNSLGQKATVTGWGAIETGNRTDFPIPKVAEIDIINTETCNRSLQRLCNTNWCGVQNQICAGILAGSQDACKSDPGGPLLVQIPLPITSQGLMHYVIGVSSFSIGCALPNRPGVYTRVSSYIDWIENIVWK